MNRWGTPEPALARAPLNLYLVEGGYPIIVEDMMIGALGVGGASGGDEECGHAALEKVLGPQPPIQPPPSPARPAAPRRRRRDGKRFMASRVRSVWDHVAAVLALCASIASAEDHDVDG